MGERKFPTESEYLEVIKKATFRSVAGHVLATSEDADARSVASYVLSGGEPVISPTTRSREDLVALLAKIDGVEGQKERAMAIRAQLQEGK